MAFGLLISTMGANWEDDDYQLEKVIDIMTQPLSLIFTSAIALFLLSLAQAMQHWARQKADYIAQKENQKDYELPQKEIPRSPGVVGLLYICMTASVASGWSSVLTKIVLKLLVSAYYEDTLDFEKLATYIFVLPLPWLIMVKLNSVANGMKLYHARLFLPLYQGTTMIFTALCGAVYFLDFAPTKDADVAVFSVGLLLTLVGVLSGLLDFDPKRHFPTYNLDNSEETPLIKKAKDKKNAPEKNPDMQQSGSFLDLLGHRNPYDEFNANALGFFQEEDHNLNYGLDEELANNH